MKKSFKFLLLCALLGMISSCKKKGYTCGYNIFYQPVAIIFKGFSANDLKKVAINTYQPDGQFGQVLSTDTFDYSDAAFLNDTAVLHGTTTEGFYRFTKDNNYSITIVSANQVFKVSNVRDGDLSYSWVQSSECSMGAGQARISALLLDLNGTAASTFYLSTNHFLVCLSH